MNAEYSKAKPLLISLGKLYPRSNVLRGLFDRLSQEVSDIELMDHWGNADIEEHPHLGFYLRDRALSGVEARGVLIFIRRIEAALDHNLNLGAIAGEIDALRGSETDIYYVQLKQLYLRQALVLDRVGQKYRAFDILIALSTMDPFDLTIEAALRAQVLSLYFDIYKKLEHDGSHGKELADLEIKAGPYDFFPPALLANLSIFDIGEGRVEIARDRMNALVENNPLSFDYLQCAFGVAQMMKDSVWNQDLFQRLNRIAAIRPWDIEVHACLADTAC